MVQVRLKLENSDFDIVCGTLRPSQDGSPEVFDSVPPDEWDAAVSTKTRCEFIVSAQSARSKATLTVSIAGGKFRKNGCNGDFGGDDVAIAPLDSDGASQTITVTSNGTAINGQVSILLTVN